ncbi:MAG TPA: FG-GAP-like repeat-containing protein [Isosphaeraceae bacterium]|nr:FG-GAP-like repeat-containing protein [Isosphaeraceae bacterium]
MNTRTRLAYAGFWSLRLAALVGLVVLVYLMATTPDDQADRGTPPVVDPIQPSRLVLDGDSLEDGGFGMALQYTPPIHDPRSLQDLREAIGVRGRLGLAVLQAHFDHVRLSFRPPKEEVAAAALLQHQIGLLHLYEGRFAEAAACFQQALTLGRPSDIPEPDRARRSALLGIVALRQAEGDDPRERPGASRGIFPIARTAVPAHSPGARAAVQRFTAYLEKWPEDLGVRWLLNLAYMRLSEYPDQVPGPFLIPLDAFRSPSDLGRFDNVASQVGLTARGPNLAGGSLFEDFNGDGLPDLFTCSLNSDRGAALFLNRGDGTFEDGSARAGLDDQIYALNATGADYDNDGDLDVLLLRGGWEAPMRLSLLSNQGDGRFEDVTLPAGLAEPIATGSAAWGDYDNDGYLDLFVCGEYRPAGSEAGRTPDPRNRCRLYHNRGDGTFEDVAAAAGVVNERCARGAAWGDYDDDGRPDLYVSNRGGPSRLYQNQGDGTFVDVAPSLEVTGAEAGFACWFWDFDNDGRLDLYVNDHQARLAEIAASALGRPAAKRGRPRLYRNLGAAGFRDVAREVGLDRPLAAMGSNFGDIDNDGYLDLYVGHGWRSISSLVPNRMFQNVDGRRFDEVTLSSGTGSLDEGTSVSFADWDADGDLDLFVAAGGAVPGDPAENLLFRNPGHGRHWLKIKLVGTRTNRAALGARIRVDLTAADGRRRSIYRTVGNNSSSGGNSLVESIGLRDATRVAAVTVSWPTSRTTQTFGDLAADQAIEITEGAASYQVLRQRPAPGLAR